MKSFCVVVCVVCALMVFSVGSLGAPPKAVEQNLYTVDTIDQELTVVTDACAPAICAPVLDACACPNGVCPVQPRRQKTSQILLPPKKSVVTVERSHKGLVRSVIGVATVPVRLVGKVVTGVKQRVQGRRGARQTRRAVRGGGCC